MTFTPHPKAAAKAKKPGAMRSKPKGHGAVTETERASIAARKAVKGPKVVKASTLTPKPKPAPSAKPPAPEGASKTQMITAMLSTAGGATSKEMEAKTGWAPHSVRGLLGTMRAKGVKVVSTKLKGEPTIYRIEAQAPPESVGDVV